MSHKNDDDRKHGVITDMTSALVHHVSGKKEHPVITDLLEFGRTDVIPLASALAIAGDRAQKLISIAASGTATIEDFFSLEPIDGFTVLQIIAKSDEKTAKKAQALLVERESSRGKMMADAKHRDGNERKIELLKRWKTGDYASKNDCADANFTSLKMSYETARKALRGAQDPDPWPAKKRGRG